MKREIPVRRIAVVGAGISGLSAAWLLSQRYEVTLYEAAGYLGGHTNTVDVTIDGVTHPVDTGFLVFNRRTYPNLCGLFAELDVPVAADLAHGLRKKGFKVPEDCLTDEELGEALCPYVSKM